MEDFRDVDVDVFYTFNGKGTLFAQYQISINRCTKISRIIKIQNQI